MKVLHTPVLATETPTFILDLNLWSELSLEAFLQSELAADISDAIDLNNNIALREILSESSFFELGAVNLKDATFEQAVRLIGLAPGTSAERRIFFNVISTLGKYSRWWVKNQLSWQQRDYLRERMGLECINPILRTKDNLLEIIFKRTGHCSPWGKAPRGYRYATVEEVETTNHRDVIDYINFFMMVSSGKSQWMYIADKNSAKYTTVDLRDVQTKFQKGILYVPLVNI